MNNFKITSKFKILAIISAAIIVLGMALGTVFHFTSGSFFNYGGEYSSYKQVSVTYYYQEMTDGENSLDIRGVCEDAFASNGVKSYAVTEDSTSGGTTRVINYRFGYNTDSLALQNASDAINAKIEEFAGKFSVLPMSYAAFTQEEAIPGGEKALAMGAVVLACVVAVHFIYTLIRFKLTAMLHAFAIDLHNIALFAGILALCRIPVTSTVITLGVLVALATSVCVTLFLERVKRNLADEANSKLTPAEIADLSGGQTLKTNIAFNSFFAIIAVLAFALMAISSLSAVVVLPQTLCALAAAAVTGYGVTLFSPALYPVLRSLCKKITIKKPSAVQTKDK